jgi:hypothetical protein
LTLKVKINRSIPACAFAPPDIIRAFADQLFHAALLGKNIDELFSQSSRQAGSRRLSGLTAGSQAN